jgi:hypothetical protein
MSDNEQRAHDLALATFPFIKTIPNITEATEIDLYASYLAIYNALLDLFNRDFPPTR